MITRETENDYEQGANIRSNDALHRLALGAPHSELREIWQDSHFQENHLESRFYPILLDHIEGNANAVSAGLSALSKSEVSELKDIFRTLLDDHEWIAGVARTSLEILGKSPEKERALPPLRFILSNRSILSSAFRRTPFGSLHQLRLQSLLWT